MEKPEVRKGGEEDCNFKLNGEKRVWEIGSFDYILCAHTLNDFCSWMCNLGRPGQGQLVLLCLASVGASESLGAGSSECFLTCVVLDASCQMASRLGVVRTSAHDLLMAAWLLHSIVAKFQGWASEGKPGRSFIAFSNPVLKVMLCIIESHTG